MTTRKGNAQRNAQRITNVARIAADSMGSEKRDEIDGPNGRLGRLYLKRVSGRAGRRLRALMTRRTGPNG